MKPVDIAIAIGVAMVWGVGFIASRLALDELSPVVMTAARFSIAAVPCLFLRCPDVSWPLLLGASFCLFMIQFLAQAYGITHGVPVGLLSVIVQSQALFTIAFAAFAFHEIPTRVQIAGIGVATLGLLMICGTVGYDFSLAAFAVVMTCPITFAIGNLLVRKAGKAPMFELFSWLSLVSAIPLLALVPLTDGVGPAVASLRSMSLTGWLSIITIGAITTSLAYWLWGRLLRDYTAAQVVPFALLVPFIGSASSAIVFGERFGPLRFAGMITVVLGIAIMLLFGRARTLPQAPT
ncbi:MAG: EamA family transporter [Pseudomonadota bacterium]